MPCAALHTTSRSIRMICISAICLPSRSSSSRPRSRTGSRQHGAIRISFLNHDTGISTFDIQTGNVAGVLTDYVVYATNCLGDKALHFDLHGFDTQLEQLQALQNDEIDLIFHASQNPRAAEENGIALSNTVLSFSQAALTTKNHFK